MWTDQHLKCQLASMFLFFNLSRHVAVSSALSLTPISKDFMRQDSPVRCLVLKEKPHTERLLTFEF